MNTKMKTELVNDVLTGLLVAATFAAVVPGDAMAQLTTATTNARANIAVPFATIVTYISYGLGMVMTVAGIAGAKKHADAPQQTPLGPALGKLGAGMAFLAAPFLVGMIGQTGSSTLTGTGAFSAITF